jgi:PAS domain S-box-containing protein
MPDNGGGQSAGISTMSKVVSDQPIDFKSVFEAAPTPYLLLRPDSPVFTVAGVNDAYLRATGTERSAIVGCGLFEVFPENPGDAGAGSESDLRSSLDRVVRDRVPDTMGVQKYDIPLRDGSERYEVRYWSPLNTPIIGADGQLEFILHRVEDVTEFVLAHQRDKEASETRIEHVSARADRMSAEVMQADVALKDANRQLKQASEELASANEKLKNADRAKTEFFANVSHEFRTPLTLLLGPLEQLLARPEDTPTQERELAEMAHRGAVRLMHLVNTLLDFSRIEAGRAAPRFEPTDLGTFTAELASHFHSTCLEAGLRLSIDCPPLETPVPVDRDMWEKIVLNLISNAFKFTFEGEIAISVKPVCDQVELIVRDSGVGIASDELSRIFERFHRVEGQRGRTFEGSGIGLALVQELVKLHGGTIEASSTVGKGSRFCVTIPGRIAQPATISAATLPRAQRAASYAGEAQRWLPSANAEPSPRTIFAPVTPAKQDHRPQILLVDDNADMRTYVTRILEDQGYAVSAVPDGETALARIREGPAPDLVLSDVMMPGALDGFGLLRALRNAPETETLPIVLLSARAGEAARIEGLAAGADEYLVKPFGPRELVARIDAAIRLARMRREAAAREQELESVRAAAKLRLAMDTAKMGEVIFDLCSDGIVHTPGFAHLFGRSDDYRLTLEEINEHVHPDDRDRVYLESAEAFAGETEYFEVEHRIIRQDGAQRWLAGRFQIERSADGEAIEATAVYMDITERKWVEERQRLLLDELNHRVKNTLSTVQSIAVNTRRGSPSPEEFGEMFQARIAALAGAHDLLTQGSWEGASLGDVVERTLSPYVSMGEDEAPRILMGGPRVRLSPNAAVTLNMAFHELATNAVKYGALSNAEGRLDVLWTVDRSKSEPAVELIWNERGGPPVLPPERRGFGSRLLEQGLARELDGEVDLRYEKKGLTGRIRLPVSKKVSI